MQRHILAAAAVIAALSAYSPAALTAAPAAGVQTASVLPIPKPKPPERPAPTRASAEPSERHCLAEAIYFEARGEPLENQIAIAHVVLNRVASKAHPAKVCAVIREGEELGKGRCQFHFRCDGRPDVPSEWADWQEAQAIAGDVLAGRTADPTQGALHFHAASVSPPYTDKLRLTARIGSHVYYAR